MPSRYYTCPACTGPIEANEAIADGARCPHCKILIANPDEGMLHKPLVEEESDVVLWEVCVMLPIRFNVLAEDERSAQKSAVEQLHDVVFDLGWPHSSVEESWCDVFPEDVTVHMLGEDDSDV